MAWSSHKVEEPTLQISHFGGTVRPKLRTRRIKPFLTLAFTPPTTALSPFQTADQSAQAVDENASQEKNTELLATQTSKYEEKDKTKNTKKHAVNAKHAR